jgi:predicted flap endonuclease-1-like 5' DNA nuclease
LRQMLAQLLNRVRNYFLPGQAKNSRPAKSEDLAQPAPVRQKPAKDDLTVIRGIGAATQQRLYGAGFTTYEKLAAADPTEIRGIFGRMAPGAKPEQWIDQARALVKHQ